jgi:hypothetical protein
MSIIAINIDREIRYIGAEVQNAAEMALRTRMASEIKQGIYSQYLNSNLKGFSEKSGNRELLQNIGSQYINSVIIDIDNSSTTSYDNKIRIELIDVRIDLRKEFDIKKTSLVSRQGSVKEFIQQNDYTIRIDGNIYTKSMDESESRSYPNIFPIENLKLLQRIFADHKQFQIANVFLNEGFDIFDVVLQSADFNQSGLKYFNVMPFSLNLLSDSDYDFLVQPL